MKNCSSFKLPECSLEDVYSYAEPWYGTYMYFKILLIGVYGLSSEKSDQLTWRELNFSKQRFEFEPRQKNPPEASNSSIIHLFSEPGIDGVQDLSFFPTAEYKKKYYGVRNVISDLNDWKHQQYRYRQVIGKWADCNEYVLTDFRGYSVMELQHEFEEGQQDLYRLIQYNALQRLRGTGITL